MADGLKEGGAWALVGPHTGKLTGRCQRRIKCCGHTASTADVVTRNRDSGKPGTIELLPSPVSCICCCKVVLWRSMAQSYGQWEGSDVAFALLNTYMVIVIFLWYSGKIWTQITGMGGGWMAALERHAGMLPLMTTSEMKQTETSSLWTATVSVKRLLFPNKPRATKTLKTVLNKKKPIKIKLNHLYLYSVCCSSVSEETRHVHRE